MQLKEIVKKKRIYIPSILFILYTIVGFLLVPVVGKNVLISRLSTILERKVTIEKVFVNPFLLTIDLNGINIEDKNKGVLYASQGIKADASWASVFTFSLIVSELLIDTPVLHLSRYKDGIFNFSDLLETGNEKTPSEPVPSEMFGFTVENVKLNNGEIVVEDKMVDTQHVLNKINVSIPFISSKKKHINTPVNAMINSVLNKTGIDLNISSTPFAKEMPTNLMVKTDDINLLHYLTYLPIPDAILIEDGDLNLDLAMDFRKADSKNLLFIKGRVQAKNAKVVSKEKQEILTIPFLNVNVLPSDLMSRQIHLSKADMGSMHLNISRDKNGDINLLKSFGITNDPDKSKNKKEAANSSESSFIFTMDAFEMKNGTIVFFDDINQDRFKTELSPIDLQLKNIKFDTQMTGSYSVDLKTESNESVSLDGDFETMPLNLSTELVLNQISLSKYAPYYNQYFNGYVEAGTLSLDATVEITQTQNLTDLQINAKEIMLQSLVVNDSLRKDDVVHIPVFKVANADINVLDKKLEIGSISSQDGNIFLNRLKNGEVTLLESLKAPHNKAQTVSPETPDKQRESSLSDQNKSDWKVSANLIDIKNYSLLFQDNTPTEPVNVKLSNIDINAVNLYNYGDDIAKIESSINWNEMGKIKIKGDTIISRSAVDLDLSLDKIDIKSVQPYFTDEMKILVTSGDFNTKGNIKMDFHLPENPKLSFTGETSLTNFISLDKKTATDFFKCKSLYFSGLQSSAFPVQVIVKDISLTDFYSRIIVSESGEINLNTILNQDKMEGSQSEKSKKDISKEKISDSDKKSVIPLLKMDTITLQGGNVYFSDYLTQPNFTANLKEIAGSVKGLSSDETARAKLHIEGVHGESSPLIVTGSINPLSEKKFVDLDVSFKDIELASFTPYSSKYLGYKIEKGKLILDLEYLIEGEKLNSENRIKFDNLTLGEQVPSEEATNLPIGLAISLLQDSKGIINLDLPVTGELDDPEFNIGSIIFKMITNLILKVVASPFSIIGSLFGGGEELEYVDFEFGEDVLEEDHINKLDILATILSEKSKINLDIQPSYNKIHDAEALREKGFIQLLKAEKLKSIIQSGAASQTIEDIELDDEELDLLIQVAYDQAQFPKPRDEEDNEKELEINEKKKLLITSVVIDKNDLRLLSMSRSEKIKSYLISTNKVENKRIFLLEPIEKDHSEGDVASRVKFLLK